MRHKVILGGVTLKMFFFLDRHFFGISRPLKVIPLKLFYYQTFLETWCNVEDLSVTLAHVRQQFKLLALQIHLLSCEANRGMLTS